MQSLLHSSQSAEVSKNVPLLQCIGALHTKLKRTFEMCGRDAAILRNGGVAQASCMTKLQRHWYD